MTLLTNFCWPGNIRELQNLIERLVLLAKGETINCEDVNKALPKKTIGQPVIFKEFIPLVELEKIYYQHLLDHIAWVKSRAAKIAGVSKDTITNKIKDYHLVNSKQ